MQFEAKETPVTADRSQWGWDKIRGEFPVLKQTIGEHRLSYLDNAASSQMPQPVIDRWVWYQSAEHSNVHRGVHRLSQRATEAHDKAREKVRDFLNAPRVEECIFTRGTTEAINLVASSFGETYVEEGDVIILSAMEHHSNIVPWQQLCERRGAEIRVIPMTDKGELELDALEEMLDDRVKLIGVNHVSNALGTVNPIEDIVALAEPQGVAVLVDGAQAVPHMKVDVQQLGCDFYAFSGHKMCGPTGIGALWGKKRWLEEMTPYQGGGDMILSVSWEGTKYNELPFKFEAGTPAIADAITLGAAIDYLQSIGMERIDARERELLAMLTRRVGELEGIRVVGEADHKASVFSFEIEGVHPHDIGTILDSEGVAIRAGHHCAQPVMERFGIPATARASLAFYNDDTDISRLIAGLHTVKEIFGA